MKLEITRKVEHKETVEIELPYYYKYYILLDEADVVVYGKVEENRCTAIKVRDGYGTRREEYELIIEDKHAEAYVCYMTDEHRGSESEYLGAKASLLVAAEAA